MCDLEVDVNGEATFMVNERILSSFSKRLNKLFSKLTNRHSKEKLKIIFSNFPCGAYGFELITRWCYNCGNITTSTPFECFLIYCATRFMEIGDHCSTSTEHFLDRISDWNSSEQLVALKHYNNLLPEENIAVFVDKLLDCLIGKLYLPISCSPSTSFSDISSSFQFSSDTRSNDSVRNYWFEELLFLESDLIEKVVRVMLSRNLDHGVICKYLVSYLKTTGVSNSTTAEKCKISEIVVTMLYLLEPRSLSIRYLFEVHRLASLWRINKRGKFGLEFLMGSRLDKVSLNYLLVTPPTKDQMYDVDLVLRLVRMFFAEKNCCLSGSRGLKVSNLIDSYLVEVAPDIYLKPDKFVELVSIIPDFARSSSDKHYTAIDIFLQVHVGLSEEEKIRICCSLNCAKLSVEASRHLARNSKFWGRCRVETSITHSHSIEEQVMEVKLKKFGTSSCQGNPRALLKLCSC